MKQRIVVFLKTLQLVAKYDKAAVIAGLLSVLTLLAVRFGFRLNASDTAYLASFLSAAVAAFTHVHFNAPKAKLTNAYLKAAAAGAPTVSSDARAHGEHEKS